MANITLKTSCNGGTIRFGEQSKCSDVNLNNSSMPKYVGARATVTRTEEGVVIWMSDYMGETREVIDNSMLGATDYADLDNKPQIEGVTLDGNKMFPDLNLEALTNSEIQAIFDNLI